MKALKITSKRTVTLCDIEEQYPQYGEVKLALEYVGFCGSDLNTFRGMNAMAKADVIPGHEIGAVVLEIGEGCPSSIEPGQVVTVNPYTACGVCPACRNARPNACRDNETLGVQRDGAMRQTICLPWEKIIPAGSLSSMEASLVEPMSVGFHAVARAQVCDTDTVLVFGCGMVGLGAVVRASLRGARVIAGDIDPVKLDIAREMGACEALDTSAPDFHERLSNLTGGNGPDVVIEAVGSPVTYRMAVDEAAYTSRVVCIGYSKTEVSFQTSLFVKKELDIRGSRNAMPSDFEAVIRYLERRNCPLDRLISSAVGFEGAQKALEDWDAAPGKVFRILLKIK